MPLQTTAEIERERERERSRSGAAAAAGERDQALQGGRSRSGNNDVGHRAHGTLDRIAAAAGEYRGSSLLVTEGFCIARHKGNRVANGRQPKPPSRGQKW